MPRRDKRPTTQPFYLRREGMAHGLSMSERQLSEYVRLGIIPVIRLGRRCCLFDPVRVREALERYAGLEVPR